MTARAGRDLRPLQHVLASLARIRVIPRVTKILDGGIEGTNRALRDAVLAEIPAYTMSGNPFILLDLERHTSEHVDEIRRLFRGVAQPSRQHPMSAGVPSSDFPWR